jgi:hypothetical protein
MFWVMGPCTFTDLDNRPSGEEHDGDWANNVLAHAEPGETEYWRLVPELSYQPDTNPRPKLRVRILDIERFEGYRFRQLRRNVKEVLEAKKYPDPTMVFRNAAGRGARDFAVVRSFDKWAALDRDSSFSEDYEEVHGQGSWRRFLGELGEAVVRGETEFQELSPELSAPPPATTDR